MVAIISTVICRKCRHFFETPFSTGSYHTVKDYCTKTNLQYLELIHRFPISPLWLGHFEPVCWDKYYLFSFAKIFLSLVSSVCWFLSGCRTGLPGNRLHNSCSRWGVEVAWGGILEKWPDEKTRNWTSSRGCNWVSSVKLLIFIVLLDLTVMR